MNSALALILPYVRPIWYCLKRKRRKFMRFWDRFKWCVVGGFAYALGRGLYHYIQTLM